tara:strand:+ start:555 stop:1091 length:537 start_codon:yes stop_codon:yes gene_type:complete
MPCDLTSGRLLDCKDSVGGIRSIMIYAGAYYAPNYDAAGVFILNSNPITAYRYDLPRSTGSISEAIVTNSENGSTFYEDTLTIKLHRLDNTMRDEIKLIAQSRMRIFILDNNNNQWIMGEVNGAELTTGTATTGQSLEDNYGYELNFTSQEPNPLRACLPFTSKPFDNVSFVTPSPAY